MKVTSMVLLFVFVIPIMSMAQNMYITRNANVYEDPSMEANVVQRIMKGTAVTPLDTSGIWVHVNTAYGKGYIDISTLKGPDRPEPSRAITNPDGEVGVPYITLGGGIGFNKMQTTIMEQSNTTETNYPLYNVGFVYPVSESVTFSLNASRTQYQREDDSLTLETSDTRLMLQLKFRLK